MTTGIVFDIKEFAINDGPGIRLTVFMKGCPLRCKWCHNPEGLSIEPQLNYKSNVVKGISYSVVELVEHINKFKDIFDLSSGGVTFSGGEPTMQADFIYNVARNLPEVHKTLDTCGYCDRHIFSRLLKVFDLVYFDIKLADSNLHTKFTGVSNSLILENLAILDSSGCPYHIRIPLIPGITDTNENLDAIKEVITNLRNKPLRVDPLPYNICAGGKYKAYDMVYPLESLGGRNNIQAITAFKNDLNKMGIKTLGEEVKCLQNI